MRSSIGLVQVSVIIPVHNDLQRLLVCLDKLAEQTWPQEQLEIIVVDNGSTTAVAPHLPSRDNIICIREETPGSYVARNAGLRKATGDIIAFTDSDCIPDKKWIEKGVDRFYQTENCGLVGGAIQLFYQNPQQPTSVELYETVFSFRQDKYVANLHYGATANVFTHRNILEQVGLFDEALKSGGDRDWGQRVYASGYQVVYAPDALVLHPARHSVAELKGKAERIAGGFFDNPAKRNFTASSFLPPIVRYIKIWRSKQVHGWWNKLRAMGVATIWKFYITRELLRLQFGGSTRR